LRKSIFAASAATIALGTAGIAYAQAVPAAPTSTVSVSPSKAGTKAKPKAITFSLAVKNNLESKTTAKAIVVTFPSTLKLSTKGLNECKKSDEALLSSGPDALCKSSKAGSGSAHALLNFTAPLIFKVTPYVGHNEVLFYLVQTNGGVKAILHGKVKGSKMTITINKELQEPATNVFSALQDLSAKLKATKGKNSLLTSVGCKSKKHHIGIQVQYAPNPMPPVKSSADAPADAVCS